MGLTYSIVEGNNRRFEVVREFSPQFLKDLGEKGANVFLSKYGNIGCNVIIQNPANSNYWVCREVIDCSVYSLGEGTGRYQKYYGQCKLLKEK
jgi:hypothetical protein